VPNGTVMAPSCNGTDMAQAWTKKADAPSIARRLLYFGLPGRRPVKAPKASALRRGTRPSVLTRLLLMTVAESRPFGLTGQTDRHIAKCAQRSFKMVNDLLLQHVW